MRRFLSTLTSQVNEFALVGAMIVILLVLFSPVPAYVLDLLLLVNFSFAMMILFVTFYTEKPLEFSTFPSLLLMTTLFRLSLNITATRLILTDGDAGHFIGAVGTYVVGGNYVVGMVVFLILIVVQFVVITNGAQRVAEVAARFILDSLPGKQMSVDADLNMGIIDHVEAKRRRSLLERESNFYGAMDGASKFVKGDAIAGIIIIIINIVGGLFIGVLQKGMAWQDAVKHFTLLSIGDGIVTQIPALVIAIATGIIITRAATDSRLGAEIVKQFSTHPKLLFAVVGALFLLSLLPGMPVVSVLIVAAIVMGIGWYVRAKNKVAQEQEKDLVEETTSEQSETSDQLYTDMTCLPLEMKVGSDLYVYLKAQSSGFDKRISVLRKSFSLDYGFILPMLTLKKDSRLNKEEYRILVYGEHLAEGEVKPACLLAIKSSENLPAINGIDTKEPTYGIAAKWIEPEIRLSAAQVGYTIVEPDLVLLTHLQEAAKRNCAKFITRTTLEDLLSKRQAELGTLVDELIPQILSYADLQKILQALLTEQISIRNLLRILEVSADVGRTTKDVEEIVERCREALKAQISERLADKDHNIHVVTLSAELERKLYSTVNQAKYPGVPLSPAELDIVMARLSKFVDEMLGKNHIPVVLCGAVIRRYIKRLVARSLPMLWVVSVAEIEERYSITSFEVVDTN